MKRYEVWAEGCLDQGMEGVPQPAVFIGYGMGESFVEAASEIVNGEKDTGTVEIPITEITGGKTEFTAEDLNKWLEILEESVSRFGLWRL